MTERPTTVVLWRDTFVLEKCFDVPEPFGDTEVAATMQEAKEYAASMRRYYDVGCMSWGALTDTEFDAMMGFITDVIHDGSEQGMARLRAFNCAGAGGHSTRFVPRPRRGMPCKDCQAQLSENRLNIEAAQRLGIDPASLGIVATR